MMNEVGGTGALYADPDNPSSFLDQFQKIRNKKFRNEMVIRGYENAKRFDFNNTVNQYVQLIKNEA
ncbi:hypothetical protein D3C85_1895870 [compost metagenome]